MSVSVTKKLIPQSDKETKSAGPHFYLSAWGRMCVVRLDVLIAIFVVRHEANVNRHRYFVVRHEPGK